MSQNHSSAAGGWPAVAKSLQHVYQNMGVFWGTKAMLTANQVQGFDCPGCAWPEGKERSATEFCENGAKIIADSATNKKIGADFFQAHSLSDLKTRSEQWLNAQGRLTEPMYLKAGATHYTPIAWDEAFTIIAEQLHKLKSPDEAIFYTSGRTSNEAAFLYQLFVRQFGTNNLPDCSNMCHESSGVGLNATIGIGKGTVTLADFDYADAILVIGQNPGTNHPRMLTALQKAAQSGCHIISINPLKELALQNFIHPQHAHKYASQGTRIASTFLQVKIGGDIALLKGIMKSLLIEEKIHPRVIDHEFIKEKTVGYTEFIQDLEKYSWEEIVRESGVSRYEIQKTGQILAQAKRFIACWAMGITQHINGVANVQEIVNLLLMRGQIGKKGAGACPVRGHSNVQGDRTMGISEKPTPSFLQKLGQEFTFNPPSAHGFDSLGAIEAMHNKQASFFFALGGNFLSAAPDTDYTAQALNNCALTVQVSTKLNRSHVDCGQSALILPCLTRIEKDAQASGPQFVSVENTMGVVHSSKGLLKPASDQLLSEVAIIAHMAAKTLTQSNLDWLSLAGNYDLIRNHISRVIPGFSDYNKKIRQAYGFELPNGPRNGVFTTKSSKAHFSINPISATTKSSDELVLMTIRSHDQFNTTIYSDDDRYRGIFGNRRVLLISEADLLEQKLKAGDQVHLSSFYDNHERIAENFTLHLYDIPKGCVAGYFPETNVLVPISHHADKSNTPASKSIKIRLRRAD